MFADLLERMNLAITRINHILLFVLGSFLLIAGVYLIFSGYLGKGVLGILLGLACLYFRKKARVIYGLTKKTRDSRFLRATKSWNKFWN